MGVIVGFVLVLLIAVWLILRQQGSQPYVDSASDSDSPPDQPAQEAQVPNPQSQSGVLQSLAAGIAKFEGFGVPGVRPTVDNNPGDILFAAVPKTAPGVIGSDRPGDAMGIAQFDNVQDGTNALLSWIQTKAQLHPDWSFTQFYRYYVTGNPDAQNAALDKNAALIASGAGIDPASMLADALGVS